MLTAHTRKVRTYGKTNTRIVNDRKHYDAIFSPVKVRADITVSDLDEQENEDGNDDDEQENGTLGSPRPRARAASNTRGKPTARPFSQINPNQPKPSNLPARAKAKPTAAQVKPVIVKPKTTRARISPASPTPITKPSKTTRGGAKIRAELALPSPSPSPTISTFSGPMDSSARSSVSTSTTTSASSSSITGSVYEEESINLSLRSTVRSSTTTVSRSSEKLGGEEVDDLIDGLLGVDLGSGRSAEAMSDGVDVDKENQDDDEEEEPIVQRRGTRKTRRTIKADPSVSSSPSSSDIIKVQTNCSVRAKRGRKVVISPEPSLRSEVAEVGMEVEEESMIVVIPPTSIPEAPAKEVEDNISLAQDLGDLELEATPSELETDESLRSLLRVCDQTEVHPFADFLATWNFFSPTPASTSKSAPNGNTFRKVGEASYSEVYAVSQSIASSSGTAMGGKGRRKVPASDKGVKHLGELVLKVVPLVSSSMQAAQAAKMKEVDEEDEDDEVAFSSIQDIQREIEITRLMSGMDGGFVRCHGAFVLRGTYPEVLLDAWDAFEDERGSESVRPDELREDQLYAMIVLENGGVDLESFEFDKLTGWKQAWGTVLQVAKILAEGEAKARFEHRDLHEGQVLVKAVDILSADSADASDPTFIGLKATIVDFGLSRVDHPESDEPYFTPIPEDVFEGVGDQWDVYRGVRDLVDASAQGDWAAHLPRTNLMWLRHLARVLLYSTRSLKKPRARPVSKPGARKISGATTAAEVSENQTYHTLLMDLEGTLLEMLSKEDVSAKPRTRQKKLPVSKSLSAGSATMADFVTLARTRGWIL